MIEHFTQIYIVKSIILRIENTLVVLLYSLYPAYRSSICSCARVCARTACRVTDTQEPRRASTNPQAQRACAGPCGPRPRTSPPRARGQTSGSAVSPPPDLLVAFGRGLGLGPVLSQTLKVRAPGQCKWHAGGYGDAVEVTEPASMKARITLRRLWFGISALLSSVAPVFGEVSLVRSHSVMAARS